MVTERWFHFTGVHDHPQVKLYVNGALEAADTFDSAWTSGDYLVGIGNQSQFPAEGRFWDGVLDEARVSDVVRDDHWIKLDYESQRDGQALVKLGPVQQRPLRAR
jgi:Concanavalin A-like lectin/glucanases superfamily